MYSTPIQGPALTQGHTWKPSPWASEVFTSTGGADTDSCGAIDWLITETHQDINDGSFIFNHFVISSV